MTDWVPIFRRSWGPRLATVICGNRLCATGLFGVAGSRPSKARPCLLLYPKRAPHMASLGAFQGALSWRRTSVTRAPHPNARGRHLWPPHRGRHGERPSTFWLGKTPHLAMPPRVLEAGGMSCCGWSAVRRPATYTVAMRREFLPWKWRHQWRRVSRPMGDTGGCPLVVRTDAILRYL